MKRLHLGYLAFLVMVGSTQAQQVADSTFDASVAHPAFAPGSGPVVAIDEAHHNFHTVGGRYAPLAKLLANDGYQVRANSALFTRSVLDSFTVLIIANAIGGEWDAGAYGRPGFSETEVGALRQWIQRGGNLLLIADHAPMGVAAENLAGSFGVGMSKGFTEDSSNYFNIGGFGSSVLIFSRGNGLLRRHPITAGRDSTERVDSVVAFTGQSLAGPPNAEAILALSDQAFDHPSPTPEQVAATGNPGIAWRNAVVGLPTRSARGRVVGLSLKVGRGRVVVLGEAAMLSAQAVFNQNGERVGIAGMNVPGTGNKQFALNVLHWLTGIL